MEATQLEPGPGCEMPSTTRRSCGPAFGLFSPASAVQQRWFYFAIVCVTLGMWAHGIGGIPVFPVDDAYITLHNAQVLWWGHDPNFVGTAALCGATSAVHLALVGGLMAFLKPLWALDAAAWIAALVYALGLARLAFQHKASLPLASLFVLLGVTVARTPHQLMNGLETGLALAAITWVIVYATDAEHPYNRALPLLCGTIPFIRPEFIAASGLLLALRCHRRLTDGGHLQTALRGCVFDVALCAAAALPWVLWYSLSTGVPYPSTMMAKRAFFAEGGLPAAAKTQWISAEIELFMRTVGLASLCAVPLILTRVGRAGLVFCLVLVGSYWAQFPGAFSHYDQRYLYIVLPFLLYGAITLISRNGKTTAWIGAILLTLGLAQSVWNLPARWSGHNARKDFTTRELASVADACNENLPKGARLLIHDAGYISYATNFRMTDIVGLKTPSSIPDHLRSTLPTVGVARGDAINRIALRAHPDYLIVLDGWDRIFCITNGLAAHGWRLRLLNRPDAAYHVYELSPPKG